MTIFIITQLLLATSLMAKHMELKAEDLKTLMPLMDETIKLCDELLAQCTKAENDGTIIGTLISYDTNFTNSWCLSEKYRKKWSIILVNLGDKRKEMAKILYKKDPSFCHYTQRLFGTSIGSQWGATHSNKGYLKSDAFNISPDNRAVAMRRLREISKKIKERAREIKATIYCGDFGELRHMDKESLNKLRSAANKYESLLKKLQPQVNNDIHLVNAGADPQSLVFYDVNKTKDKESRLRKLLAFTCPAYTVGRSTMSIFTSRNYWALEPVSKQEFTDIATEIETAYGPLEKAGFSFAKERAPQFSALHELAGPIEYDFGSPDDDDRYEAVKECERLVERGLLECALLQEALNKYESKEPLGQMALIGVGSSKQQ